MYGVWPELVTVTVYLTVRPALQLATSAILVMVSPETVTVVGTAGARRLDGQVLPGVVELMPLTSRPLPVSGCLHHDRVGDGGGRPDGEVAGPGQVG